MIQTASLLTVFVTRIVSLFGACLISLLFAINAHANTDASIINKSPNDVRQYRHITLGNQLDVVLVHDPKATKAAASMNVEVGSGANPQDFAGLAHFLEHMLFLGTTKYPDAGEYQAFISAHGGSHNAYTSYDNTNYYFDINANDFEAALDRFSRFFIEPTLDETYIDRERHAVHSEYQTRVREDSQRTYSALKSALNQEHSYARFSIGSLDTLKDSPTQSLKEALTEFYARYYSANLMGLSLVGPQPLDVLEALAQQHFSAVKNNERSPWEDRQPLFNTQILPAKVDIQTLGDQRSLSLIFPVPDTKPHWRSKPLNYISSLLGYEGEGSLLSQLKAEGLALGLSASSAFNVQGHSSLYIDISLTEEGLAKQARVMSLFFDFVALIKQQGVQEKIYLEEAQLAQLGYQFQDHSAPLGYARGLSRQIQHFPIKHILDARYLHESFNTELIHDYLDRVTPQNLLVALKHKAVEGESIEPWFKASYTLNTSIAPLNDGHLGDAKRAQSQAMHIRRLNPFVPKNLALESVDAVQQQPLSLSDTHDAWYIQDLSFKRPRATAYFGLFTEAPKVDVHNQVLNQLYVSMISEQLNENAYDALLAGLNTSIYPHRHGFTLKLSGYNDKMGHLLSETITELNQLELNEGRFLVVKQALIDQLNSEQNDRPYNQAFRDLYKLLLPSTSSQDQQDALEDVSLRDLKNYADSAFKTASLRFIATGNITKAEATNWLSRVTSAYTLSHKDAVNTDTPLVALQKGENYLEDIAVEHTDSAYIRYMQAAESGTPSRAAYGLLNDLISAPFYTQLRTEEQLGYIVFSSPMPLRDTAGLTFVVQSPVATPTDISDRINAFLSGQGEGLVQALTPEKLAQLKTGLISKLMRPDTDLTDKADRYWNELDLHSGRFDSREQMRLAIEQTSIEDIKRAWDELPNKQLIVQSTGQEKGEAATSNAARKIAVLKAEEHFIHR